MKENKHFGIVVAEMVAAGMIPFVPNSGGQTEIVNENPRSSFDADPIETVETILQSDDHNSLYQSLSKSFSRYTREQFISECEQYLNQLLEA